jgi:hypothetical protein
MEIPNERKLMPGLPVCDWVYFATPAKESWTVTRDFVDVAKIIFCHIYNKSGLLMPNVQHLQRGRADIAGPRWTRLTLPGALLLQDRGCSKASASFTSIL